MFLSISKHLLSDSVSGEGVGPWQATAARPLLLADLVGLRAPAICRVGREVAQGPDLGVTGTPLTPVHQTLHLFGGSLDPHTWEAGSTVTRLLMDGRLKFRSEVIYPRSHSEGQGQVRNRSQTEVLSLPTSPLTCLGRF